MKNLSNNSGTTNGHLEPKLCQKLRELSEYQRVGDQFVTVQAENAKLRKVIEEL